MLQSTLDVMLSESEASAFHPDAVRRVGEALTSGAVDGCSVKNCLSFRPKGEIFPGFFPVPKKISCLRSK